MGQVPIGLGLAWRGWAVLVRQDTVRRGEACHGGLGAVRSGMECLVSASFGPARRSWPCEFRLGETGRGVSRRSS